MKRSFKSLALLIGFFLVGTTAQAQLIPEFGIKGGLNLATINNLDGTDYKAGVLVGGFAKLNIPASPVAVQPEILFAQYGGADANSDATQTLNYIQVPVLLKFAFDLPAAPVSPNVYFGPYLGFVAGTEFDDGNGNSGDLDDVVNDTDFGVVIGAGIDVSKLRIGLRYTAGLTNIYDDTIEDGEKNGAFALTVGFSLF